LDAKSKNHWIINTGEYFSHFVQAMGAGSEIWYRKQYLKVP